MPNQHQPVLPLRTTELAFSSRRPMVEILRWASLLVEQAAQLMTNMDLLQPPRLVRQSTLRIRHLLVLLATLSLIQEQGQVLVTP